jgi:hypothetical protein
MLRAFIILLSMAVASEAAGRCTLAMTKITYTVNSGDPPYYTGINNLADIARDCHVSGTYNGAAVCNGGASYASANSNANWLTLCQWVCDSGQYWNGNGCIDADTQINDCDELKEQYNDNQCGC